MFKLLKNLIPSGSQKEITTVKSYTLKWETQGRSFTMVIVNHKCFTSINAAEEYEKQLIVASKLLNVWVTTKITEND